jgi:drug/metabolite transporter (DMT)-like permease
MIKIERLRKLLALPREALWPVVTFGFSIYVLLWLFVWPVREPHSVHDWLFLVALAFVGLSTAVVAHQLHEQESASGKDSFGSWWSNAIMFLCFAPFGFFLFTSLLITAIGLPRLFFGGESPPWWALIGAATFLASLGIYALLEKVGK